jgi:hypothetical protein
VERLPGLAATAAQLAPIANDYKIAGVPVSILGLTLPALTFALMLSGSLGVGGLEVDEQCGLEVDEQLRS